MRIQCPHCHTTGTITNTAPQAVGLKTIYLQCTNPSCRARTAHTVSYDHDIEPPKMDPVTAVAELLERLTQEERATVLDRWRQPAQPLLF